MDTMQLRSAFELLATLNPYTEPHEFGSLNMVGHVFDRDNNKYGEVRFEHFDKPLDSGDYTLQNWEFIALDNADFSLSAPFQRQFALTDAEDAFIGKLERALSSETKEQAEEYIPTVLGLSRTQHFSVVFEVLDRATSTRIGNISYDPQKNAYTFKAACVISRIR